MVKSKTMRKRKGGDASTPIKTPRQKHMAEKREMDIKKHAKNKKAISEMKRQGKYLEREFEGPMSDFVAPDGTVITPRTREALVKSGNTHFFDAKKFNDELYNNPMEYATGEAIEMGEVDEDLTDPLYSTGPATFGGKRKSKKSKRKSKKSKRII